MLNINWFQKQPNGNDEVTFIFFPRDCLLFVFLLIVIPLVRVFSPVVLLFVFTPFSPSDLGLHHNVLEFCLLLHCVLDECHLIVVNSVLTFCYVVHICKLGLDVRD